MDGWKKSSLGRFVAAAADLSCSVELRKGIRIGKRLDSILPFRLLVADPDFFFFFFFSVWTSTGKKHCPAVLPSFLPPLEE